MTGYSSVVAAIAVGAVSGLANGQIIVEHDSGSGFSTVTTNTQYVVFDGPNVSGADFELKDQPGAFKVLTVNPTTDDIGVITYNGTSSISLYVMDRGALTSAQGPPAADNWDGGVHVPWSVSKEDPLIPRSSV